MLETSPLTHADLASPTDPILAALVATDTLAGVSPLLALLDEIKAGVQLFDAGGKLVYANRAIAQALGFATPQAYLQADPCQHWPHLPFTTPKGRLIPISQRPYARALKGRPATARLMRYAHPMLGDRIYSVKAMPLKTTDGAIAYVLIVTQPGRTIDNFPWPNPAHHGQLCQITDVVPSMVAYLDTHEIHRYANPAYAKGFCRPLEELVGHPLREIVSPSIYEQLRACIKVVLAGQATDFDMPLTNASGQIDYKHVNLLPQFQGQAVIGFYALFHDITAHKRAADLLLDNAEHLRYALEGGAVGTWDWNLSTQEMVWSHQQERLFGLHPGSFDGKPETALRYVHPEDRDRVIAAQEASQHSRQAYEIEFRVIHDDGTLHWLSSRGQVFHHAARQTVRMAGVTLDVTDKKIAETKIQRQVQQERLIARLAQEISKTFDLSAILSKVFDDVRQFLGVDRLIVIDFKDDLSGKVTYEARQPTMPSMLGWQLRHIWATDDKFLELYEQGRAIAVNSIYDQRLSPSDIEFLEYFNIQAELLIPLLEEKNQLWGLLVAHHHTPRTWLPEDTRLLDALATQISIAIQRDKIHQELTRANQQLKRIAYLDGLTQVANRRRFEQYLQHEWRRLMRDQSPMSLIMADIDYFKSYNDIYGHQIGDDCLRRVAGVLRSAIKRPADLVARYGGEEFVVVLPGTDLNGAEMVAEKIRLLVRGQRIPHQGSDLDGIVTLSLGVAMTYPHLLRSPDDLVRRADEALYQAKAEGRDRVGVAPSSDAK